MPKEITDIRDFLQKARRRDAKAVTIKTTRGIATCFENANTLISSSRDKTVMVWELTPNDSEPGYARKCLTGHNQAVQDVVTSSDGQFCLSASWDKTMRLWDLNVGQSVRAFVGHTSDVNSV